MYLSRGMLKELYHREVTDVVRVIGNSFEIVETLHQIIKSKLTSGEDVLISGFGKFCIRNKRERRDRNTVTGEAMMLVPRRVVTFKCSGKLRDKINESQQCATI